MLTRVNGSPFRQAVTGSQEQMQEQMQEQIESLKRMIASMEALVETAETLKTQIAHLKG